MIVFFLFGGNTYVADDQIATSRATDVPTVFLVVVVL